MNDIRLRQIKACLTIIEEELGKNWINKKINQARKRGRWNFNPIPKGYFKLKQKLDEDSIQGDCSFISEEKQLIKLALDIGIIRTLKNYSKGIPTKKLKDIEYAKYAYLANIAALSTNYQYTVSFVLEGKTKTPDLKLRDEEYEFYIECKKKDKYQVTPCDAERWKPFQEDILDILEEYSANYNIVIISLGDMHVNLEKEVCIFLKNNIPKCIEGVFTNDRYGFSIAMRKLEDTYEDYAIRLSTLPGRKFGVSVGKYEIDEDGRNFVTNRKRIQLYVIDAHDLVGISSSFVNARSQIPRSAKGVICVDVDTSETDKDDINDYFQILNNSIKSIFKNADNFRVGAIVISSQISEGEYIYMVVRNENSDFPLENKIPGENIINNNKQI